MRFLTLLIVFGYWGVSLGQEQKIIKLSNPSFEDAPRMGGTKVNGIKGWYDCGIINFPDETPPDIHPKDFWSNTKQASDGITYLGMVTRDNDSWETVSQRLQEPMKAGECYSFSIDLSKSERYISKSRVKGLDGPDVNYTTPIVLRIWGGSGYCNNKELLAESPPISNSPWKTYSFKLSPSFEHRFLTLEAFYKVPVLIPYNGHILVDNCSDIVMIPCSDEVAQVEPDKKAPPPHKKVKKKEPVVDNTIKNPQTKEKEVYVSSKPKIMNLDRSKIRKGQTIEIQNLYFKADTSSINEKSYGVLEEVYEFLKSNDDIFIEIGGHTNNIPTHEYCDKLSSERAKAVADYLIGKGIKEDRLAYKGYGKRNPIASNGSKEGRTKNQRVEIKILSIDG